MSHRKHLLLGLAAGPCLAAFLGLGLAADPAPPAEGTLVVIDNTGKEQKLKSWTFVTGTRHLGWLAPADKEPKDGEKPKVPAGPEALEFRDENSTGFKVGILTLIPVERLRSIDYDDKDDVTVKAATGDKDAVEELTGTAKFVGVNKLTIEAEVDKGELGVAAVKFNGGVPKGIKGVRFPAAKVEPMKLEGRTATVTISEKASKNAQKVTDLQALYRFADGSERLLPTLMFKKTLKIDLGKVVKLRAATGDKDTDGMDWGVTLKDAAEETFTLLDKVTFDGKPAALEGLVGRVAVGYKLFPPHTVAEIEFEEAKP
jgi:hypothetical protein